MAHNQILDSGDPSLYDVRSTAPGPAGALPLTPEMLLTRPSGDLFGWSQNAGMGWDPRALGGKEILILSTHGGIRDGAGAPIADSAMRSEEHTSELQSAWNLAG